jgi:acyl carrier protein phosphodiesterase
MNYLAHLYLCDGTPEGLIGSILGDFRKGLDLATLPPATVAAIHQHQAIDCFTDRHPLVRAAKQHLAPEHRRYAGILLDVFYDYYLSQHWSSYSNLPLRQFIGDFYDILLNERQILPDRLRQAAPYMVDQDWLGAYGTLPGVALTLTRISRRLKRDNPIADGILDLQAQGTALEASFHGFFPLLVQSFKPHSSPATS